MAELQLLRLNALARSLANIDMQGLNKEPYRSWVKRHDAQVAPVKHPLAAEVLKQLDALARRFP